MKPLVFYFTFSLEDTDEEITYGFNVENPLPFYKMLGGENFEDVEDGIYDEITQELESNFGVHDWSSSPNNNVDAIGYTTYEVEKNDISKLMNAWNNEFIESGCSCSKVVNVSKTAVSGDDFAIYSDIKLQTKE